MKYPTHPAINEQTGFLLRKVSAASFERFAQIVGEHGLHPMHFGMLLILEAEEPISQHELGERAGVDPSTMVARMDVLVERGLVARDRSPGDRRSYEICLTDAGRELLGALRRAAKEHGDEFFAALSERERRQLHRLLAKLAASIDEE
ncbi:MAG: MarR family transcriptional regulator [Actinomycetota bacterium]|nr:MarR family transcriptional regulator [Actinomycetota bacterium]